MKQLRFYAVAVATFLMLTACKSQIPEPQVEEPQCDVDPDSVFGIHYTAEDFGIWHVEDFGDFRYRDLVSYGQNFLPDSLRYPWNSTDGLLVPASDTAAYTRAIDKIDVVIVGEYHFWQPFPKDGDTLYQFLCVHDVDDCPVIDGSHILSAGVDKDWNGHPTVNWQFDSTGSELFQKITNENIGHPLAIMLGHRLLIAPMVYGEITGGKCSISGLSADEACAFAKLLNNKNK